MTADANGKAESGFLQEIELGSFFVNHKKLSLSILEFRKRAIHKIINNSEVILLGIMTTHVIKKGIKGVYYFLIFNLLFSHLIHEIAQT